MTKKFARWVEDEWDEEEDDENFGRRLEPDRTLANEDKRARYASQCLSGSVNGKKKKGNRCNKKPQKKKNNKFVALGAETTSELIDIEENNGEFYNRSFIEVVKERTDLQPERLHSVPDATSSLELLLCGLNHIVLIIYYDEEEEEYDEIFRPYLNFWCRNYEEYSCAKYEDYLCSDYEKANCRGPCDDVELSPTMSPWPTATPTTLAPTTHYTARPTWDTPEINPKLFVWGASDAIGEEGSIENTRPLSLDKTITDTAAGPGYTILLHDDGTVSVSGHIDLLSNYHGHLGLPLDELSDGTISSTVISKVFDTTEGVVIAAPQFKRIYAGADQLSPGAMHSLLIDEEGKVWTMGSNSKGQLCLGDFEDRMIPTKVQMVGRTIDAAIGGQHTLLLQEQGIVFGCGSNKDGQIGQGFSISNSSVPSTIYGPYPAETVSAGLSHSLILTRKEIYVMGNNSYGQLCASTEGRNVYYPSELTIFFGRREVRSFQAIQSSSFILFLDGSMNGCGRNDFGQLGDGTNENKFLTFTTFLGPIRHLGVGPSSHSAFFIGYNNNAYSTGLNDRGQLGLGDTQDRNLMSKIAFQDNVYVPHFNRQ